LYAMAHRRVISWSKPLYYGQQGDPRKYTIGRLVETRIIGVESNTMWIDAVIEAINKRGFGGDTYDLRVVNHQAYKVMEYAIDVPSTFVRPKTFTGPRLHDLSFSLLTPRKYRKDRFARVVVKVSNIIRKMVPGLLLSSQKYFIVDNELRDVTIKRLAQRDNGRLYLASLNNVYCVPSIPARGTRLIAHNVAEATGVGKGPFVLVQQGRGLLYTDRSDGGMLKEFRFKTGEVVRWMKKTEDMSNIALTCDSEGAIYYTQKGVIFKVPAGVDQKDSRSALTLGNLVPSTWKMIDMAHDEIHDLLYIFGYDTRSKNSDGWYTVELRAVKFPKLPQGNARIIAMVVPDAKSCSMVLDGETEDVIICFGSIGVVPVWKRVHFKIHRESYEEAFVISSVDCRASLTGMTYCNETDRVLGVNSKRAGELYTIDFV